MVNLETKEILLALVYIIFGVLIIAIPALFIWLIGLGFILFGILELIPRKTTKK